MPGHTALYVVNALGDGDRIQFWGERPQGVEAGVNAFTQWVVDNR